MRVPVAVLGCLFALVRADLASAADSAPARDAVGSICAEDSPGASERALSSARLSERGLPGGRMSERLSAGPAELVPAHEPPVEPTLWCISPDDPRCAPLESSSLTVSLAQAKFTGTSGWQLAAVRGRDLSAPALPGRDDATRPGIALRVERPPRR